MAVGSPAELPSSLSVTDLLAPFRSDPPGSAILCDFDGTLAPIVDDPAAARPLAGAAATLAGLARRYGCAGVISGRPAGFLAAHFGGRGLLLSGLYGLEEVDAGGAVRAAAGAERWRPAVEAAARAAEADLPADVGVERKGLSVTVHYRTSPAQGPAVARWAAAHAAASGLVLHPARMSCELRPPVRRDKGTVVAEVGAGRRQVCFLGDDLGDLSAFDALDRLAAAGATALRVGVASREAPAELLDRADTVVDGPAGALTLLRALLVGEQGPSGPLSGGQGPSGPLSREQAF